MHAGDGLKSGTTVGELGERALIARIARLVPPAPSGTVGIGDDAAWIGEGGWLVSADMLVEDVHFRWAWMAPEQLGHKAMAVNLSDIAAMGGQAVAAFVSLALPAQAPVAWVEGFYRGAAAALAAYDGAHLLGGDTVSSPGGWVVAVTVVGRAGATGPRWRQGGQPGDRLLVTGRLGAAYAGWRLLEEGVRPDAAEPWQQSLLAAQLTPVPRMGAGRLLASAATALTDVSDGLAAELWQLGPAQGLAAHVVAAALPVDADTRRLAAALGEDATGWALYGGEDYELVAAVPPAAVAAVIDRGRQAGIAITEVGWLEAGTGLILHQPGGEAVRLDDREFDIFRLAWPRLPGERPAPGG